MTDMIRIEPRPEKRRAFAQWAVAQNPKVRTCSPTVFEVPPPLFVQAPEEILIGALVDGQRYVSPDEDAELGRPAPGELLGVATAEAFTEPSPAPEPEARPERADSDRSDSTSNKARPYACGMCDRTFTSERGRAAHRRQVHKEA